MVLDSGVPVGVAAIAIALGGAAGARAEQTVGLFVNEPGASPGYTLFSPMPYDRTYLVDNQGLLVRSWDTGVRPGNSFYFLPSGDLLRTANPGGNPIFNSGGAAGLVERFGWGGAREWSFRYSNNQHRAHHDVAPLPNGNVLVLAWEYRSSADAIAAGRDPQSIADGELWPEHIVEVRPVGPEGGEIVWEWHAWDHLVQDFDPDKPNYGVVAEHPELIDLNYWSSPGADWLHANAIDYNTRLDQILICTPFFDEVWIIDHSTTTEEAAGHTGGNSGRGGDLLYRWGNPAAYDAGPLADRRLFGQHDAQWIADGRPGAGHLLVFNNGNGRLDGRYSSVDEIIPPVDEDGRYEYVPGAPYGPAEATWSYVADPPEGFYASFISGAQRQPNGNTLICNGPVGTVFEVTSAGDVVWRYVSPVTATGPVTQGDPPPLGQNNLFRAPRYAPDFEGFAGRDLTPDGTVERETCPADVNFDDRVDFGDIVTLLFEWGPCAGTCRGDVTRNGTVNVADLLALLAAWGPCP